MKIESALETIHSVKINDLRSDFVTTQCGRKMMLTTFVPIDGEAKYTHRPITCKQCLKYNRR